eukprot:8549149-Pyramimonas_sp.AAC.2
MGRHGRAERGGPCCERAATVSPPFRSSVTRSPKAGDEQRVYMSRHGCGRRVRRRAPHWGVCVCSEQDAAEGLDAALDALYSELDTTAEALGA